MSSHVIPIAVLQLSVLAGAAVAAPDGGPLVYRFEKHVAAQAWNHDKSKLAAEAYYVGLLAVRSAGVEQHVEEFMTGGLASDLGEELPPRPPSDPIHRTYTLDKTCDVPRPVARRGGLVVWTLPFEFFLMPRETRAEVLSVKHGLRPFASHAARPAAAGTWAWRLVSEDEAQGTYRIAGPCSGKCEGDFPLGGCLTRVVATATGTIREASASLSITMPVAARLQALADVPERKTEEEQFFEGFNTIVIDESVRMHLDSSEAAGGIDLPGSLSTAIARLRREARGE
jgi:hypothetical protein